MNADEKTEKDEKTADIKIFNVSTHQLLVTTPGMIEAPPTEEWWIVGWAVRPSNEYRPPTPDMSFQPMMDAGRVTLRFHDVPRIEASADAHMLMNKWWMLHHVQPDTSVAAAGRVVEHLAENIEATKKFAGSLDATLDARLKALTDAINLAREARDAYVATGTTRLETPVHLNAHLSYPDDSELAPGEPALPKPPSYAKLCIEHRQAMIGGEPHLHPFHPLALQVELTVVAKRLLPALTKP